MTPQTLRDAHGALRLNLAFMGLSLGYLSALAEGARGAAALAAHTQVDPAYTERWCDAAYAFELLERDGDVFRLSATGQSFVPDQPGSEMPMAVQAALGAHMTQRAIELAPSGEQPGESVLGERAAILPWFGPMLEASFGGLFASTILPGVPAFAALAEGGGLAVDLGCGNGWYLRHLAALSPRIRGIGLDAFEQNIQQARAQATAQGLDNQLSFQAGDLFDFTVAEPVDLIAMNRALHHVWADDPGRVFRSLHHHLAPGGVVVIWEPAWPSDLTALRQPAMRGLAFQNLAEHVQGNHFLRPDEIAAAMRDVGLEPQVYSFVEGREAVIVGRKP